ncbi:MAG: rRNA maturation RNase YbeY [Pseudomonadota bacterium]
MSVEIAQEDPRWASLDLAEIAERATQALFEHLNIDPSAELALLACDDARITELNGTFRDKPKATNVLSWPSLERRADQPGQRPEPPQPDAWGAFELGDIALGYETCLAEAEAAAIPFEHHVTHLIMHATLHLLGYDHINSADGDLMEEIEVEVLASLGLHNPY